MIRLALPSESETLTRLTFESKGHWGYPKAYFDIWASELTLLPTYIEENDVFVFERVDSVVGYYSIVNLEADIKQSGITIPKGFWLEHMFIAPACIGQGIGTELFAHCRHHCVINGIHPLGILADPNAKGFYLKMGCHYQREYPSTIPGRTTPYLVYTGSH